MFISRKKQKKSLLEFMESIVDTRDVYSTKSLYEAWEQHFGFKGKKYANRLEAIRLFLDHGTKIEAEFGMGALLDLDHPDVVASIDAGILGPRTIEDFKRHKNAYLESKNRQVDVA
jgi:hypothetical protein